MSLLHIHLLRGVVVLPMLVLLAVASVTAPAAPKAHVEARAQAHVATVVVIADDGVVMVQPAR